MASGECQRPTTELSAIHQRQLFSVFKHVDKLLTEMLAISGGTTSGSPFEEYLSDLPAERQAELRQNIENMRRHILRILEEKGIPIHKQSTSAAHAVRIRVQLVEIAFEELKPKRMGGYGQLAPQARHEMQEIINELAEAMRHFQEESGNGKDLQNR
jgi:hypothetical protein